MIDTSIPTHERLKNLIAHFVLRFNYWGYLFSRVRRRPDSTLRSIMGVGPQTDGTITLYYNPKIVDTTHDDVIEKVLEHEGMHLLNGHIPRSLRIISNEWHPLEKASKFDIWNKAADCAINEQAKLPKTLMIGGRPWVLCHPEIYELEPNNISEYYYTQLLKKAKKIPIPNPNTTCPNCGKPYQQPDQNQPQSGQSPGQDQNSQPKPGQGQEDQSGSGQDQGQGQGDGDPRQCQGDQPGSGQGQGSGQGDGQPHSHGGGGGTCQCPHQGGLDDHGHWSDAEGCPDTEALARKVESHVGKIVRDSAKSFNRKRGSLPGHIQQLIDSILAPPAVPYYQIIRRFVRGTKYSKFKRSSTKINRKRTYLFNLNQEGIPEISPFPGRTRDFTFKIAVLIDTSGSQTADDIREALRGVKNIIDSDRHTETWVIEIDTVIQKEYRVKKVRDIDPDVKGRGGTTLRDGLFRAKELGVDVCLGFTDGMTEDINAHPRRKLPKKLIWIIRDGVGTTEKINRTGPIVRVPY